MTTSEVYGQGGLITRHDYATRTVTDYTADPPTVRQYTEAENAEADERAEVAARLSSIEDRLAALESIVLAQQPKVPDDDVPDWSQPTGAHDAIPPAGKVRFDGEIWQNVSGAWLVHGPDVYPLGWQQLTGLPPDVTEWAPGQAVAVGDLRTYGGVTYRCIQAHTTQAGWTPVAVPSLWATA